MRFHPHMHVSTSFFHVDTKACPFFLEADFHGILQPTLVLSQLILLLLFLLGKHLLVTARVTVNKGVGFDQHCFQRFSFCSSTAIIQQEVKSSCGDCFVWKLNQPCTLHWNLLTLCFSHRYHRFLQVVDCVQDFTFSLVFLVS